MFKNNFNAEKSIKKWANAIQCGGVVYLVFCVLAALIILCVDEYLWFVSLIVFGNGILTCVLTQYFSVMVWGFGDIVGNTKRLSSGMATPIDQYNETELPEL